MNNKFTYSKSYCLYNLITILAYISQVYIYIYIYILVIITISENISVERINSTGDPPINRYPNELSRIRTRD